MKNTRKFRLFKIFNSWVNTISSTLGNRLALMYFITIRHPKPTPREKKALESLHREDLDLNGYPMATYRYGNPSERKILQIHGWSGTGTQMHRMANYFVERGYEVISFDAPGHGRSQGKHVTLIDFVKAIECMTNHFGPFEVYIGHSFGGMTLLNYLKDHPSIEAKAVLINSPTVPSRIAQIFCNYIGFNNNNAEYITRKINKFLGYNTDEKFGLPYILPMVKQDILWIHDQDDDEVPFEDAQEVANQNPTVNFVATKGFGHRKILIQPSVFKCIDEFISK